MSWISGLADKAEQILTTIDQNAAEKLQKKKQPKHVEEARLMEVTTVSSSSEQHRHSRLSPAPSPAKKWLPQVRSSPSINTTTRQPHDDEKLIDYLNDDSKPIIETNGEKEVSEVLKLEDNSENEANNEKQMLKNEIRVLNNELSLLLHRTRAAEKETEFLKSKLQDAEKNRLYLMEEVEKLTLQVKNVEQHNETLLVEKNQLEDSHSKLKEEELQNLRQQIQSLIDREESLRQNLESKDRECVLLTQQHQQETDSLHQRLTELRTELDQYRVRAQRTLSDKEALISQLRANNSDETVYASLQTELTQLRNERQQLNEDLAEAQTQAEGSRSQALEAEHALGKVREAAAATRQELTDLAAAETHRRRILEDDCRMQTQELQLVREELAVCRSQLSAREVELRSRPPPPTAAPVRGELEHRLSSLTKTLIHKQTALESATTECNQLRMQMEELEHKHREHLLLLHQTRVIGANDTDDAKAQVPSFLVESPMDTGVTRRVKRAYSSLDAVSIRTGVFLRRYPLARILVVLYVVLLHSLVLLVLYSRTPDNAQK